MLLENIALTQQNTPIMVAWPCEGNAGGFLKFDDPEEWRAFIMSLSIHPSIPAIVAAKFARADRHSRPCCGIWWKGMG